MSAQPGQKQSALQATTTAAAPRGQFSLPSPEQLSARLPNLEVRELIGHGGMGVVYKGWQPLLERNVAIKVVRPDLLSDPDSQQRFLAEARTLARLVHPYIVTVFDCGRVDDLYFLVMEFVEGSSLRQLLEQKKITERDAVDIVQQIGEALEHAHGRGVVHRDVKPENVLIDDRDRVRLVDFGLAKLFAGRDPQSSGDHLVVGTPRYMAPEQIAMPGDIDQRADIYSTGVVFHEMLTGELPGPRRQPPSTIAATNNRLDPIVLRAIEPDRDRRYQQARELNADLASVSRTDDSTIKLERTIAASPDEVFAAWTNPAVMVNWFAPSDDFATPIAEVDLQVAGKYRVGMRNPNGNVHIVSGKYCRVDPPNSLCFTWAWDTPRRDSHETQVTLEIRPHGDGTNLIFTHERFRDSALRDDHAKGWTGCLDRLVRKLSK